MIAKDWAADTRSGNSRSRFFSRIVPLIFFNVRWRC